MKLAFRGALTEPFAVSGDKIGVIVPTGWSAADMTFQVSHDRVSFFDLYGYDGDVLEVADVGHFDGGHGGRALVGRRAGGEGSRE